MRVRNYIRRLFDLAPQHSPAVPAGRLIYAIGDVHGCDDLLEKLLEEIERDAAAIRPETTPLLIFLGDYIDRGPASKAVVDRLVATASQPMFEVRALMGNHEAAFLTFLDDPNLGSAWYRHGGAETVASYCVPPPSPEDDPAQWWVLRDQLRQAVPAEHMRFLVNLELLITLGDYAFVHAGVRPGVRLSAQKAHDLLWIRDEFIDSPGPFGKVIVHGHTIETRVVFRPHRLGVDTGAYATGMLTAVRLMNDTQSLIQVGRPGG
jgi:serine/threonine protein phosphatase 1